MTETKIEDVASIQLDEAGKKSVEAARAAGHDVMGVSINGKSFAYRSIMRGEWKVLLRKRNEALKNAGDDDLKKADIMEDELESLLKVCLVHSPVPIQAIPAGTVQSLADAILALSGFGGIENDPIKL